MITPDTAGVETAPCRDGDHGAGPFPENRCLPRAETSETFSYSAVPRFPERLLGRASPRECGPGFPAGFRLRRATCGDHGRPRRSRRPEGQRTALTVGRQSCLADVIGSRRARARPSAPRGRRPRRENTENAAPTSGPARPVFPVRRSGAADPASRLPFDINSRPYFRVTTRMLPVRLRVAAVTRGSRAREWHMPRSLGQLRRPRASRAPGARHALRPPTAAARRPTGAPPRTSDLPPTRPTRPTRQARRSAPLPAPPRSAARAGERGRDPLRHTLPSRSRWRADHGASRRGEAEDR
ncbi:hypothetical protein LX15_005443 [Streptoalloteichus tenebrarius]|uniref:Uncharacterized protein n=1 Tax=Streptoalloteichus tenebrarius (strain ATCC 17920 / DSM 40477 / JCM 4838 / CBS 697.72 / NBRC 16177 / NCIMB 11028 / NRRL B-12390 / A12253. 1 / ISP 5477) TaxID=1933 RepID=A0ABT1I1P9_STRSD|nr:hypothetical protein [Streptoalloteichus tenebrarius]